MIQTLEATLSHFRHLIVHKYYVLKEGIRLRVPIQQLLVHDLGKLFDWRQVVGYISKIKHQGMQVTYAQAIKSNKLYSRGLRLHLRAGHHWQAWLLVQTKGLVYKTEIPERYVREMLADWSAFALTYKSKAGPREYYLKNKHTMILHPNTEQLVEKLLDEFFPV